MSEKNNKNSSFKSPLPDRHNPRDSQKASINLLKIPREISERRYVQETYRMLERAVEQSIDGIGVIDMDGIIRFCNQAWAKMHGYCSSEILGKHLSIFHTKEQMHTDVIPFNEEVKKKGFYNGEVGHLKKDGTIFSTWMSTTLLKDEKGNPIGLVGIARDITENKAIENALKVSEAQYRTTIDSMADVIHVVDRDLKIVLFNEAFKQWSKQLGLIDEVIGKTVFEVFPFLPDRIRDEYRKVFEKGKILITEEYHKIKENEFVVETRKIPIFEDGVVVRVMTVIRDVSERKKAEEVLQTKERFLSSVFESIQDGISVLDKDMRIVRVNSAIEKWYEHAMPLVGKKCFQAYHGRDKQCDVCPTRRTLETAKAAYEIVPRIGKNGKIVGWLDLYSFPLIDTQTNQINGVIEYVRDITKRKQAEEKSERLYRELFKSNRRLKQLVLRDSHTGLYNHRYLNEAIEAEFSRAQRYTQPLSVIMLDLDYFKSVNDVYGHQFGDLVLKQFARQIKRMMRQYDIIIRFGGEEFIIISPDIDKPAALNLAQRLTDVINLASFGDQERKVKLKLSAAVVSYPEDKILKGMDLIELVDRILNKAKEDGGDRVYSSLDIKKGRQAFLEIAKESSDVRFLKEKIEKLNKRANQSLIEAVFAFAKTIKLKDHYTGEHVENTVRYATEIARRLGLSKEEIEHIRRASMVHDLGKIGISEKILLKRTKLTRREFEEIKKHPQIGADILRPIHFLSDIVPLILYHHERWDGRGYPSGLKKEEIPTGARIVAIADVYQALISDRPYRRAHSRTQSIRIIQEGSSSQFDPKIVDAFLKIL